jgi:hypothetical protein
LRSTLAIALAVLLALGIAGCSRSEAATRQETPPLPTPLATTSAAGDAGKPFGAFCVTDSECSGAVCFHKRLKTPDAGRERRGADDPVEHDGYCSLRCNDDRDCPVPPSSGKCGARGMCKRPN